MSADVAVLLLAIAVVLFVAGVLWLLLCNDRPFVVEDDWTWDGLTYRKRLR